MKFAACEFVVAPLNSSQLCSHRLFIFPHKLLCKLGLSTKALKANVAVPIHTIKPIFIL